MDLLHILEFAQEQNSDELYAQIRDLDSSDEKLSQIADSYENADIDDEQFCNQVEEYLAEIGYNC